MSIVKDNLLKLKNKALSAPKQSGVYFWLGKKQEILYIGRATSLRNRLNQYFQKNIDSRISEMISLSKNIKFETTETVLDAIILEAKYIKKYWPKYNVRDKDDRSFIYLVIPKLDFAKPIIIRGRELGKFNKQSVDIFGPYQSYQLLEKALRLLRPIFPYSLCQAGSGKACFDYQIGLCPGTCLALISKQDYKKNIDNLKLFFKGEKKRLFNKLMKENPEKVKALKHIQEVSLLSRDSDLKEGNSFRIEAYDISHHAGKESYGSMVVFENGEANKSEYRLFKIKEAPAGDDERALLEVLSRRLKHENWDKADILVIDGGSPQISFLNKALHAKNINLPLVGISKLAGDKLIFPPHVSKEWRALVESLKDNLLKSREEAHRFANVARKKAFAKKDF